MSKGKFLIVHYSEIGLKGQNRKFFEEKLVENLRSALGENRVQRKFGKIVIELKNSKPEIAKNVLGYIPGIASYAFAEKSALYLKDIQKTALSMLANKKFKTFGIVTRRSNKKFPHTSAQINIKLGDVIRKKLKKKVDLRNPDLSLYIDISEKDAFVYLEKFSGIGGLPVGSSGKAVALLSGGIDSPVAAFMGAKRGLKMVLCHVQNKTMTGGREGAIKIEKIAKQLTKIQGETKLYVVPFEEIQKAIIAYIPAESRMIIYRRFMMRIAEQIAENEKAKGIITGDSIGQVASQTLDNLKCVYEVAGLPVLPPLIGMNKEEIIKIARQIGTYELSILPYPDCCSFMIAKHPETKANLSKIEELEKLIPKIDDLINTSIIKAIKSRL